MKLTVTKPVEIEADSIRCILPFDSDDEIPGDFPGVRGETIDLTLDIDTGKVRDWSYGEYRLYLKVRDSGIYTLLSKGVPLAKLDQDYVPGCIPQEYGDYVRFYIEADGTLNGWRPNRIEIAECFFPKKDD